MKNRLNCKINVLPVVIMIMLILIITACSDTQLIEELPPEQVIPATPLPRPPVTEEPDTPYICTCTVPAGEYAPVDGVKPAAINTATPANTFVVGTPPMNGDFLRGWGNNPYDTSIKTLTGGYRDTYYVTNDGQFSLNESVVCRLETELDDEGNKTCIFTLHNYLKWSNGEPITAADYVASILTYASQEFIMAGGVSAVGDCLVGIDSYRQREESENNPEKVLEGVQLLDEYKFSVTISHNELPFFWQESFLTFTPVYLAGWFPGNEIISSSNGACFKNPIADDLERIAATERYAPTVTCGPYKFAGYEEGVVTLERNEYFGVCREGFIPFFEIIIQKEISESESVDLLHNGEIDFYQGVDISRIEELEIRLSTETAAQPAQPDEPPIVDTYIAQNIYPRAGYGFMEFALDFGPTRDLSVRLAAALLLDREAIITEAFGGKGQILDGAYSPAQWVYIETENQLASVLTPFTPDITRANELLDETGWIFEADGETLFDVENTGKADNAYLRHNSAGEPLRIIIATDSDGVGAAINRIAGGYAMYAGMEIIAEQISFVTLLEHYYYGKDLPDAERRWNAFHLAVDFTPVDDKYWQYHSSLANTYLNSNGISDEQIDELVMAMRSLEPFQKEQYAQLWLQFQIRLRQILPALPLYVNYYTDAYNTIVTGMPVTGFAGYADVIMHIAKYE